MNVLPDYFSPSTVHAYRGERLLAGEDRPVAEGSCSLEIPQCIVNIRRIDGEYAASTWVNLSQSTALAISFHSQVLCVSHSLHLKKLKPGYPGWTLSHTCHAPARSQKPEASGTVPWLFGRGILISRSVIKHVFIHNSVDVGTSTPRNYLFEFTTYHDQNMHQNMQIKSNSVLFDACCHVLVCLHTYGSISRNFSALLNTSMDCYTACSLQDISVGQLLYFHLQPAHSTIIHRCTDY